MKTNTLGFFCERVCGWVKESVVIGGRGLKTFLFLKVGCVLLLMSVVDVEVRGEKEGVTEGGVFENVFCMF